MRADLINKSSASYGSGGKGIRVLSDATTATLSVDDSGKIIVVPDLTATCTIDLPAEEVNLVYEFIYGGAAADAQNFVVDSESDTNYFVGGVTHFDTDAGSGGDEVVPVYSDGNSNSKLTVVTPDAGTRILMVCDGVKWYVTGVVVSSTVPTFADQ